MYDVFLVCVLTQFFCVCFFCVKDFNTHFEKLVLEMMLEMLAEVAVELALQTMEGTVDDGRRVGTEDDGRRRDGIEDGGRRRCRDGTEE